MDQEETLLAVWLVAARRSAAAQHDFDGIACRYFTPEERMAAADRVAEAAAESTRAYHAYMDHLKSTFPSY